MTTILLIEGKRSNGHSFAPHLEKRYDLLQAPTGKVALSFLESHTIAVVVLDASTMRSTGERICRSLRQYSQTLPIIHIKDRQDPVTEDNPADLVLHQPFTYRKLCNRIDRFVSANLGETKTVGPFTLNINQNLLTSPSGESKLTPKVTELITIFLNNPDTIIERKTLIQQVWQTDYMGDTRTLDVHIRWVREAMEKNPSKPQYIRTVRGKGYLFQPNGKG